MAAETEAAAALPVKPGPPWLRRWSDALRAALCGTAAALVLSGRASAAVAIVFITMTAIAARLARAPAAVESAFVTLLALDAWLTSSGVMARIDRHDTAGHLILTAALTPVLAAPLGRLWPLERASIRRTGALAGLAAVGLALAWELVEWSSDTLLGTSMSLSATDTMYDLMSGLIGAAAGALIAIRAMSSAGTRAGDARPARPAPRRPPG